MPTTSPGRRTEPTPPRVVRPTASWAKAGFFNKAELYPGRRTEPTPRVVRPTASCGDKGGIFNIACPTALTTVRNGHNCFFRAMAIALRASRQRGSVMCNQCKTLKNLRKANSVTEKRCKFAHSECRKRWGGGSLLGRKNLHTWFDCWAVGGVEALRERGGWVTSSHLPFNPSSSSHFRISVWRGQAGRSSQRLHESTSASKPFIFT